MKINLFTNYYITNHQERQTELDFCKSKNNEVGFNHVFRYESQEIPKFLYFFEEMKKYPNDINVICNSDIFFDREFMDQVISYYSQYTEEERKNKCLVLTRWDYISEDNIIHRGWRDSQDTWVFYGSVNYDENINDIQLGTPGCDNRILWELLHRYRYEVSNPSLTIKTYHFHNSDNSSRSYLTENLSRTRFTNGPFEHITPTKLNT